MQHLEREFKSALTKEEYELLINKFDLKNKIYIQTNYYFDTLNHDLRNSHDTLRIRVKEINNHLTYKKETDEGQFETTIVLDNDDANNKIQNGFDANELGINHFVQVVAKLKTSRTRFKYDCGEIFIDKNDYYGITDYEIEFEINENVTKKEGEKSFLKFLEDNNLVFKKQISKIQRAYKMGNN